MTSHTSTIRNSDFIIEQVTYPSGLHMPMHKDRLSGVSIIINGVIRETTGTSVINATSGSILIKPNNILHENTFGNIPVTLLTIRFFNDSVFNEHFKSWQFIDHPKTYNCAIKLWTEMRSIRKTKELMNALKQFTSQLLKKPDEEMIASWWIDELKEILKKGQDQNININEISQKLCLHRVYMGRAFKKNYGISPKEYRKHIRIASVLTDLFVTQKTLTEIALDAGFSDQSHMSREFKSITNCTPAAVKKSLTLIN